MSPVQGQNAQHGALLYSATAPRRGADFQQARDAAFPAFTSYLRFKTQA